MRRPLQKLVLVVLLAAVLSGCTKCGDWFWDDYLPGPRACHGGPPAH